MTIEIVERAAEISSDGLYRYWLRRKWGPGPTCLWIMLNPSTADAEIDDPTIRRIVGFSHDWGYGQAVVVNLFAFRATEPALMFRADDPVGPLNEDHIARAVRSSARVVAAWGERGAATLQETRVLTLLRDIGIETVWCVGKTNEDRAPRHPLYVRKTQQPEIYWTAPTQQRLVDVDPDNVHRLPTAGAR